MNKPSFVGLRGLIPGDSVFAIKVERLDKDFDSRSEEVSLKVATKHASIDAIVVNEMKSVKLPGDITAIIINGGNERTGATFTNGSGLIDSISDLGLEGPKSHGSKQWIGKYQVALSACNAHNESEIMRLTAAAEQIAAEIKALKAINQANDDAASRYEQ